MIDGHIIYISRAAAPPAPLRRPVAPAEQLVELNNYRGLIDLNAVSAVEKVLGVNTFVMKGQGKVYLFKLEPHDEVMMRTWIGAISQEVAR